MRPRRATSDEVAETARRRLELLTAELASLRQEAGPGVTSAHGVDETDGPSAPVGASASAPVPEREPAGRHARRPVGLGARATGWLLDRVPPTLRGRAGLGPGAVGVVALLVVTGLAVTAWWVVRAEGGEVVPLAGTGHAAAGTSPEPAPSALVSTLADPDGTLSDPGTAGEGATTEEPAATVVVDVAGKVRRRGIVTLPLGARVVDALDAAGGPRRGVDLTTLNLARVLVDGEQVVVGMPHPGGVAASAVSGATAPTPDALLDLNRATESELESLPGVGPVTAAAIVAWRTDHGPFTAVDELLEVSGIGDARLADIAPHVTL